MLKRGQAQGLFWVWSWNGPNTRAKPDHRVSDGYENVESFCSCASAPEHQHVTTHLLWFFFFVCFVFFVKQPLSDHSDAGCDYKPRVRPQRKALSLHCDLLGGYPVARFSGPELGFLVGQHKTGWIIFSKKVQCFTLGLVSDCCICTSLPNWP